LFLVLATLMVGYPQQSTAILLGLLLLRLWLRR